MFYCVDELFVGYVFIICVVAVLLLHVVVLFCVWEGLLLPNPCMVSHALFCDPTVCFVLLYEGYFLKVLGLCLFLVRVVSLSSIFRLMCSGNNLLFGMWCLSACRLMLVIFLHILVFVIKVVNIGGLNLMSICVVAKCWNYSVWYSGMCVYIVFNVMWLVFLMTLEIIIVWVLEYWVVVYITCSMEYCVSAMLYAVCYVCV